MYELLGISLVLTALLTVNALASLATAGTWRLVEKYVQHWTSRTRAEVLFAMRLGPPALALTSVALFLIPAYLSHEPYSTNEVVSKKLGSLAAVSAVGVFLALWRSARSWLATRRLLREWLSTAVPIPMPQISVPTYLLSHRFPIMAVVGTWRPRLFVARQVLESLTAEELTAALAHECGHLRARDNLKRSLLRASCDALLIIPCGRSLDRAWAEASECAADEYAAEESPSVALNLASALVRIARMIPAGTRAAIPAATFLVGTEDDHGLKARIRRLLEIASAESRPAVHTQPAASFFFLSFLGLFVLVGTILATTTPLLVSVHDIIERAVALLC